MSSNPEVVIVRETLWQSVLSDAVSFASAIGLMGVGVVAGSSGMEWAGFLIFALLTTRVSGKMKNTRKSPQEAADYLLAEFGVRAKDAP